MDFYASKEAVMRRVFVRTLSTLTGNQAGKAIRFFILGSACIAALSTGGCGFGQPRRRLGCYATSTPGTRFVSSDKLGTHSYGFNLFEKNGITYACNAGHIDIAHLRIAADNTKYMTEKLYKGMLADQTDFTFALVADRSKHIVKLSYPDNWQQIDKEPVAREVSLQLGQYLAFSATTWHEMLTWFGYRTMAIIPEFSSAFSWEDIYSNLIGTGIASKAIQDTDHKYNKAMTLALSQELERLGGRSGRVARKAAEKVRGEWFTGNLAVSMKKRNLDIGIDDGFVTPMIVPGICSNAKPEPYPVPSHDVSRYGFSMDYHIIPKEFEKGKILRIVHNNRSKKTITPDTHYASIMAHIANVAIDKYGPHVATPYDPDTVITKELARAAPSSNVDRHNSIRIAAYKKAGKYNPDTIIAKELARIAPSPNVDRYSSPNTTAHTAAGKKDETVKASTAKVANNTPKVRVTRKTKTHNTPKSTAVPGNKEYPALRVIVPSKTKNYDAFHKILDSTAKKFELMEKKWKSELKGIDR